MPDLNDLFGFRPDRPTHPDMTTLSNVILRHDGNTEDPNFNFAEHLSAIVDPESLIHLAKQRALRVVGPLAPPEALAAAASLFMDGFLVGHAFEAARRGSYDEACKRATTDQGLDPVLAALSGVAQCSLEQTGGFTMVVTVPYEDGTFAVTASNEAKDRYLVIWYPGKTWTEGPDEPAAQDTHDNLTLDEMVEIVTRHT